MILEPGRYLVSRDGDYRHEVVEIRAPATKKDRKDPLTDRRLLEESFPAMLAKGGRVRVQRVETISEFDSTTILTRV